VGGKRGSLSSFLALGSSLVDARMRELLRRHRATSRPVHDTHPMPPSGASIPPPATRGIIIWKG